MRLFIASLPGMLVMYKKRIVYFSYFLFFFFPPGDGGVKEAFESYRFDCEGKMYILMQIFLVGNGKCFVIIIDNPRRLI